MKTFRQNLNNWLEEKKKETTNQESINLLEEVQTYIKSKETEEEYTINRSYRDGYYDCEFNKGIKGSYYKDVYKKHDYLKKLTNTLK